MRALMLAFSGEQPYHVMRALAAAGHKVHVLARDGNNLKHSRYCSSYHHFNFDPFSGSLDEALAEITRLIQEISAELVLPTDIVSTRLLIALAGRLPVPTSALPDTACFDMLNDKWQFQELCKKLGVSTPTTWIFEETGAVKTAVAEGSIKFPIVAKPLDGSGGFGVHRIMDESGLKILDELGYKPILVQKLIVGKDVDISVLANKGRIVAYAIQHNQPHEKYSFIHQDKLLSEATLLVEKSKLHGLAHFDAIVEKETEDVYLIECNTRPWMSIFASLAAGLNFIGLSLKAEALNPAVPLSIVNKEVDDCGSTIMLLKKVMKRLIKERRLNKPDYNLLKYNFADPIGKKRSRGIDSISFVKLGGRSMERQMAALSALRAMTS